MVSFVVAQWSGDFRFSVSDRVVLLAGSRHLEVGERTYRDLLNRFHFHGFHLFVGCDEGVDRSFLDARFRDPFREYGFIACAFRSRTKRDRSLGLHAGVVVPFGLHPAAALRRRTLWMVFLRNPYDTNRSI